MEDILLSSSFCIIFLLLAFKFLFQRRTQRKNLPPSPPSLPIIGHLHLLKPPLHRTLHSLAQKYGPVTSLRLGHRLAIVVSSPSAVEECLTKNDIVFANRPPTVFSKFIDYNGTNLVAAPYGDHWRNLRRLTALDIFSSNPLNKFSGTRRDEVKNLLRKIYGVSNNDFAFVELSPMLWDMMLNIITVMVAGKRYCGEDVTGMEEARQFREMTKEILECAAPSFAGDYLPVLRWIDYQGFGKRVQKLGKRADKFFQGLIDEHLDENGGLKSRNTMISHLLSLSQSQSGYYTDEVIKSLILAMLVGATETTSITVEWAMANLVNHPEVLEKAKNEIDTVIDEGCLMEESHLSKLPYLRNIILETLRLYPPGPLLLPHFSHQECTVGGYDVPQNTLLLINAWAIQRDPTLWHDASSFKPERFDSGSPGMEEYRWMPFGLGRRSCPGMGMANRVMGLALGSMIQCFDWKRVTEKEVDMAEGDGLSMPKAEPLVVLCKASNSMSKILSSLN